MAILRPKLKFIKGKTYIIDVSDPSNAGHPLRFTADSGATEYTTGVTATGTAGTPGATVTFAVPENAPNDLNYYCLTHGLRMGNKMKTVYDPNSIAYRGTRAWGNGGSRGDTIGGSYAGPVGGGSTDVHYFDIVTKSNSTEVGGILSYLPHVNNASAGWSTSSTTGSKAIVIGAARSNVLVDDIYTFDTVSLSTATSFGSTTSSYEGYQSRGTANDGFRTVAHTGRNPTNYSAGYDKLHYITNAQEGNSTAFGDLTYSPDLAAMTNDATRGIICGGNAGTYGYNTVNYITIQTVGNATSQGSFDQSGGFRHHTITSDETYAVQVGGRVGMPGSGIPNLRTTTMKYFNIQSLADASLFGYLNKGRSKNASASDGTTGVMWGGEILSSDNSPDPTEWALYAEHFTIQTPSNATDFGFQLTHGGTNPTFGSGAAA
tara:strand:+ start:610 stop:1905 length:1296 start_codon:yes stop_codon:yes gene_type:complete